MKVSERERAMFRMSVWALGIALLLGVLPGGASAGEFPDEWFFYPEGHETREEIDRVVGKPAPPLKLTGWINGKPETLKGKIVVVDFWATWCGPCLAAIPHTNQVAAEYADRGVVVIGACTSSGQEKFKETAEAHDMQYPAAKDPGNRAAKAWGVRFYPTYAVVDRSGVVRAIGLKPTAVEKVVEKLLEEDPAEGEPEGSGESE